MPLWSEDPSGRGGFLIRNRHNVTEIIIGCLEFQLTGVVSLVRADVEDRAQLSIAMGVGLNRSTVIGTNHRPSLLDVDLQPVIRPEQFLQIRGGAPCQLLIQPLERVHPVQLIQAGMAKEIPGEIVAITELRMLIHLAIKSLKL